MPLWRSAVPAAIAAVAVIAAGCVQQTPAPLPEATPTFSCTPVTGGTPYPCYENQFQQVDAQNKLYEEAEAVYRKYNAENVRILRDGGVTEVTAVLAETTTGSYQEEAMNEYRNLRKVKGRLLSGELPIVWVKRVPEVSQDGSVATLEACKDISDALFRGANGNEYQIGEDNAERVYFVQVDSRLKISSADHQRVKTC